MRKIIIVVVFFFSVLSANAQQQPEATLAGEGSYLYSGGFNFTYQGGTYYEQTDSNGDSYSPWSITINPSAEYFTFNMIAFGAMFELVYEQKGADISRKIAFGPIISFYYNGFESIVPYVTIFATYSNNLEYVDSTESMYWADMAYIAGGKLGVTFMVSRQVGIFIEAKGQYELHKIDNAISGGTGSEQKMGYSGTALVGAKYFIF